MTGSIRKWADEHQYDAEPQPGATEHEGVLPSVQLIHMPEDPLGVLAAQNGIYSGKVFRSLEEVTDSDRRQALEDMMRTTLQSPLEAIKMHFLFEGVDRAFTHQLVRQRTANYGQESLRFSVVGPLIDATTVPADLHGTRSPKWSREPMEISLDDLLASNEYSYAGEADRNRLVWDWAICNVDEAYHRLVEQGLAAEDARGLLPHATATRIHYQTDMRALMKVAGERLCTQAQFPWKMVLAQVVDAVRNYKPTFDWDPSGDALEYWEEYYRWQFEAIADSGIFRPVCFHTNECMFKSSADRSCSIRERVETNVSIGRKSRSWHLEHRAPGDPTIPPIRPEEWLLNPAAARKRS